MSVLVALVRHGAHDELGRVLSGRASGIGLNPQGQAEVAALAVRLRDAGIRRVETSPQARTRETADILGEALGLAPATVDALDEIDFGVWAGQPFAALEGDPDWHAWNTARATAPIPGGETMQAAVLRATRHLDALGRSDAGPVAAVSHCDVIRGVVAHYLGLGLNNILRFDVAPASVCWLKVHGQGMAQVLTLNGRS